MLARKLMIALCAAASATFALAQTAAPQQPSPAPAPAAATADKPAVASDVMPDGGEPKYLHPETPEQRRTRLGTPEDPGPNPDPAKHYWRFGSSYHIEKFDRRWASYDDVEPGNVRAFAFVNVQNEVYQQNDKYVWVWMRDMSKEELDTAMNPPPPPSRYNEKQLAYFRKMRTEFFELTPKTSNTTVRFEESSEGLPTSGSWRNNLTVADMNGDGCPDIVAPPERAGGNVPAIFLGDCKGHWKFWSAAKWPRSVDYGSVVAADFNGDGHMDLAFGVHLTGIYVFFGDGKGNFTDATGDMPGNFPTRRLVISDVDRDGMPDIVAINEGPTGPRRKNETVYSRLRVYLNRDKGKRWEQISVAAEDSMTGGDYLAVGDVNGDRIPDLIAANIFYNSNATVFLSKGPKKWEPLADPDGNIVPFLGYYFANATGRFSSKKADDAIVSYVRFWPSDIDPNTILDPPAKSVVGIDRISFSGKEPVRTPIVRWPSNIGVWGLGVGDFDGDGNLDIAYTRHNPRELVVLLGDGKGGFTRAKTEGVTIAPNTNYDLKIADVNGDGKPDIIVMYESSGQTAFSARDGSIHVFLNRGATSGEPAKAATK